MPFTIDREEFRKAQDNATEYIELQLRDPVVEGHLAATCKIIFDYIAGMSNDAVLAEVEELFDNPYFQLLMSITEHKDNNTQDTYDQNTLMNTLRETYGNEGYITTAKAIIHQLATEGLVVPFVTPEDLGLVVPKAKLLGKRDETNN